MIGNNSTYPPLRTDHDYREEEVFALTEDGELLNPNKQPLSQNRPIYGDGDTIDWLREESAERERLRGLKSQHGVRGLLLPFMDASRMWFVIVLVGIGIGVTGAWLDVLVKW